MSFITSFNRILCSYLSWTMASNGEYNNEHHSSTLLSSYSQSGSSASDNNKKEVFESPTGSFNDKQDPSQPHSAASDHDGIAPRDPMVTASAPASNEFQDDSLTSNSNYSSSSGSTTHSNTSNIISSSTPSDSIAEYNTRRELENYYKDVGALKARSLRDLDPTALSLPERRLPYLDEAITYNVYLCLKSLFCPYLFHSPYSLLLPNFPFTD
jgi:hypothetical protein